MRNQTPTVLMLACPAPGHVNPMMNLALKLSHNGFHVIFVITDFAFNRIKSIMVDQVGSETIQFVSIPDGLSPEDDRTDLAKLTVSMINTMPIMFEKLIEDIQMKGDHRITCVVADVVLGWGIQVACKMGIKGALLWTASAATFAMATHISTLMDKGVIDSDGRPITKHTFQLAPSMPEMDTGLFFWSNINDPETEKTIFHCFVKMLQNLDLTEWWLCNTTYELEPAVLSFIPKILPIGPLLSNQNSRSLGQFFEEDLSCINWLDQQPHCSVVYIAFGSFALFDQNQFTEIALGLELTNRPFLWVVREDYNRSNRMTYPNEFKGKNGKIVAWAPQQKVLSHPAIACFVSHCGWNSSMEGLSNGVPFLCWPYFSDQFYDKHFICHELKVGLEFDKDENGLVSSKEIKLKVDQLLNDENIRSRSMQVKKKLMSNIAEGGGSSENLKRFVMWLKE
ncbi:putative 7-deoxyloganetin glucosyltransferase [Lupinus albus]|uniref:Putative 7-deoxyloganetin glucosyltransferase n=1 Tax=Lupinus albus TaxID=3870 RepID=A0A6A4R3S7_LUPAL|nr:putative 7-deoxyloganetin glucosyltransferase [Lupinus albus]